MQSLLYFNSNDWSLIKWLRCSATFRTIHAERVMWPRWAVLPNRVKSKHLSYCNREIRQWYLSYCGHLSFCFLSGMKSGIISLFDWSDCLLWPSSLWSLSNKNGDLIGIRVFITRCTTRAIYGVVYFDKGCGHTCLGKMGPGYYHQYANLYVLLTHWITPLPKHHNNCS